ncbi:MAG: PA14 domain-containing protein [Polyangiaceae bacterium]
MDRRVGLTVGAVTVLLLAACQVSMGGQAGTNTPANQATPGAAATPGTTPAAAAAVPTPKPKPGMSRASFTRFKPTMVKAGSSGSTPSSSGGTTPPSNLPPVLNADNIFGSANGDADSFLGSVYFLTGTPTTLPDLTPMTPSGTMFTKSLGVAPQNFEGNFPGIGTRPEWFAIRYEGPLTVAAEADYQLRLVSDDGAKLSIDDMVILNNDGIHEGPKEAKGPVHLIAGTHAIRIDYLKGGGKAVALQVYVQSGSTAEKPLTTNL